MKASRSLFALLFLVLASPLTAQEDFLEFYYKNPQPERFVEEMKNWAADGTLENDRAKGALIAFISQVARQNRERIRGWFEDLAGLTQDQKQVLFTGLLYSRTSEADEVMRETFGKQYDDQKVELAKILEMPLDKEETPNMLWGFFYATGSESALRRIVLCFRFEGAPDDPEGVDVPENHVPIYKILPTFAFESLAANADRHGRVLDYLERLLENDDADEPMTQYEKDGVYDVLSTIKPDKYPPIDRSGKSA